MQGGFLMDIKTLEERIQKAKEKIIKKQNILDKKQKIVDNEKSEIACLSDISKKRSLEVDIEFLEWDIRTLKSEIETTKKTLEKYRKQLYGEIAREKSWIDEVPEVLKSFQIELVSKWDEHDIQKRDRIRKACKELPYDELKQMYHWRDREWAMYTTDDQIHESNEKDAISMILNLVNRVKDITGEITDWSGLTVTVGTWGGAVLNGYVGGKEGRCCVESIGAGGYNIQRYHIRVLVKPIN
jgi:predicted  nucleic acid-binding Zn-ribbon protein